MARKKKSSRIKDNPKFVELKSGVKSMPWYPTAEILAAKLLNSNMKQPKLSDMKVDVQGTKALRKLMAKSKNKHTVKVFDSDEDFLRLREEIRSAAKKAGITKSDLAKAIKKARRS